MKLRAFFILFSAMFVMNASAQTIVNTNNVNTNTNNTTSVNTNTDSVTSTSNNTNINKNDSFNRNIIEQTLKSPPPTAIAPQMMSGGGNDLCTTGISGAVQTQILGIAAGKTVRDMNCERLKLSKTLYDMGMKVAAVSTLCQDDRVFDAMMNAGTPCPIDGKIGNQAKVLWEEERKKTPTKKEMFNEEQKTMGLGLGTLLLLLLLI